MRPAASLALVLCWLFLSFASALGAADAQMTYETRLAQARALAAEGSRELSAIAFREASLLTTDEKDKRWCALWAFDQESKQIWDDADARRIVAACQAWLASYQQQGLPPDAFWLAARELLAAARPFADRERALGLRLETARYYAGQPRAPETEESFTRSVIHLAQAFEFPGHAETAPLIEVAEFLREAEAGLPPGAALAEVAVRRSRGMEYNRRLLGYDPSVVTTAYEEAVRHSRGTAFESVAALLSAQWRVSRETNAQPRQPWSEGDRTVSAEEHAARLKIIDDALAVADRVPPPSSYAHDVTLLKDRRTALLAPALSLGVSPAFLPESRFVFRLSAQHIARVELALHRIQPDAAYRYLLEPRRNRAPLSPPANTPLHQWTVETGVVGAAGSMSRRYAWDHPLPPGIYLLVGRDSSGAHAVPAMACFFITAARGVLSPSHEGFVELRAYDQASGKPLQTQHGSLFWSDRNREFSSGSPGVLRASATGIPREWDFPVMAIGDADGHPFVVSSVITADPPEKDEWRFHLNTDRDLYLPGEKVRWKLTARVIAIGELKVPEGEKLKVSFESSNGAPLGSSTVSLNRFGSASGELVLPPDLRVGNVSVTVEAAAAKVVSSLSSFTVDRFRSPEAELTLAPAADEQIGRARAGREVKLELKARYYSGEPIRGATVAVAVNFRRNFVYQDMPELFRSGSPREAPKPYTTKVITDEHGRALLHVPLSSTLPENFKVSATATLTGYGVSARGEFSFDVTPAGYAATLSAAGLAPNPEREEQARARMRWEGLRVTRLFSPAGKPLVLQLATEDGRKAPVAARGDLTVERLTWEEIWRSPAGDLLTGEALRAEQNRANHWPPRDVLGWEKIRADYRTEAVSTQDVATAADGRVDLTIPPLPAGYYRVAYHAEERPASGRPLGSIEFFVADEKTGYLPFHSERSDPVIVPVEAESTPGRPVRALVIVPPGVRHALVELTGIAGSVGRVEEFSGNARLIEFPWLPSYWSGARLSAFTFNREPAQGFADILPSRAAHLARVTAEPESPLVRPGEKSRVTIRTTDLAGRPVPAEVAVAVADAALASFNQSRRAAMDGVFLHTRDPGYSRVTYSPTAVFMGARVPGASLTQLSNNQMPQDVVSVSADRMGSFNASTSAANVMAAGVVVAGSTVGEPRVRRNFSYTAGWFPEVATDASGQATVEVSYPDNLTAWQVSAEAIGEGSRFGRGEAALRSTLPLQARLRLPRSVVAGDQVTLLGAVVNGAAQPVTAQTELVSTAANVFTLQTPSATPVIAPAQGEAALAWTGRAQAPGSALLRFSTTGATYSDAMELTLPVKEDGFEQRTGAAARAAGGAASLNLALPSPLDPARTRVTVQVSPGVVPALIDALPYLIDYPYGCVEQTTSRFVPAVLVARLLRDLKFTPEEVGRRIMLPTPLPPPGRAPAAGLAKLDAVITDSLDRLKSAQRPDGSFGWFPAGQTDAYMTGYVLRSLNLAVSAGIVLPEDLLKETREAVFRLLGERNQRRPEAFDDAWLLAAALTCQTAPEVEERSTLVAAFEALYARRAELPHSGLALLLTSAHRLERADETAVLRRNLENGAVRAATKEFGATVRWGRDSGYFRGIEGAVESTALALSALLAVDPNDPLVDAAATWLLVNRTSNRWNNTRDTALAVEALLDYASAKGDALATGSYRLSLNGRVLAEAKLDRRALLAPTLLSIDSKLLQAGDNRFLLEPASGTSPCFLVATARSWAAAETGRPSGDFLKVSRGFVRLVERPAFLGAIFTTPTKLPAVGATVARNERLECRLVLELKQPLDYLAVEAPKPGGCEPLNALSGWDARLTRLDESPPATARDPGQWAYREEHDDRSVFFLPHLPAGRWEIRYTLRATFSGDFRVLPASTEAMYVPVIAGNSEATRIAITEKIE